MPAWLIDPKRAVLFFVVGDGKQRGPDRDGCGSITHASVIDDCRGRVCGSCSLGNNRGEDSRAIMEIFRFINNSFALWNVLFACRG